MSRAEQRAGLHGHLVCLPCPTAPEGSKRFISTDPHEMGDESDSWTITLHHFHKKLKHLHENHPRSVKGPQRRRLIKYHLTERGSAVPVSELRSRPPWVPAWAPGHLQEIREDPWRTAWQSTPVFLPRESHGQRSHTLTT